VHRYHFLANAKALIENETEGQWIIVTDKTTGKILGSQITGAHATELIHLIALSIRGNLTLSDVADTVFAHPSLSESFQESMKRGSLHAH
jgi:dihydrolipoamide dehydrogenase